MKVNTVVERITTSLPVKQLQRRKPVKKRRGRIPKVVKTDVVSDEDFLLLESFLTELLQKPEFSIQVILLIIKKCDKFDALYRHSLLSVVHNCQN